MVPVDLPMGAMFTANMQMAALRQVKLRISLMGKPFAVKHQPALSSFTFMKHSEVRKIDIVFVGCGGAAVSKHERRTLSTIMDDIHRYSWTGPNTKISGWMEDVNPRFPEGFYPSSLPKGFINSSMLSPLFFS
jgi:hypothetical protein